MPSSRQFLQFLVRTENSLQRESFCYHYPRRSQGISWDLPCAQNESLKDDNEPHTPRAAFPEAWNAE